MKHVEIVLKKMFEIIGEDYSRADVTAPNWFWKHTWTKEQENEFVNWLADYFYENKEARREMLIEMRRTKKMCRKAAVDFVWQYGWKSENNA